MFKKLPGWVIGILAFIFILRIPSFFEPYYYGDEMIYMTLGQGVRQGLTLYKDIHDNKPPLLYLAAAVSGNLFWFKVILAAWNIISIIFFYKLSTKIFRENKKIQKISTTIFALLTTLPLLEGLTVNSELFMIGFTIIALFILVKDNLPTNSQVFLAGTLFGLGTLFKIPAAFDMPIIIVYWLIVNGFKNWIDVFKKSLILILGFLTPIFVTFIYYFFKGALNEYIKAAFLQNVGYLSSFRPGDVQKPFIVRNAPLLMRASIAFFGTITLFIFRKKLTKEFILLTLWILFGLFAVTLSERPYPHYLIQIVAPLSFLMAMFFAEKTIEQALVVIPLAIAFFVPFYYKFYFYPTLSYYSRFINFADGRINKVEYFQNFSSTTNRNYKIAEFIQKSSRPNDRIFMWDPDSAAVYALSRRVPPIKYVADYHINDYSNLADTSKALALKPPKFIILTSGHPFKEVEGLLKSRYILAQQTDNANIYLRINLVQTP